MFFIAILVWSFQETCAKEVTEANRYPRLSCSIQLLIDVTFIWFTDKILLTLTSLKWRIAFDRAKNKTLQQNRSLAQE